MSPVTSHRKKIISRAADGAAEPRSLIFQKLFAYLKQLGRQYQITGNTYVCTFFAFLPCIPRQALQSP